MCDHRGIRQGCALGQFYLSIGFGFLRVFGDTVYFRLQEKTFVLITLFSRGMVQTKRLLQASRKNLHSPLNYFCRMFKSNVPKIQ